MNNLLPIFFQYLEGMLKSDKNKSINLIVEFSKFLEQCSQNGDLDSEYDKFSTEDFFSEAEAIKEEIIQWPIDNSIDWIEQISPSRWMYRKSNNTNVAPDNAANQVAQHPANIQQILVRNASSIQGDELDILRDYLARLNSKEENLQDKKTIAEISFLIASNSYKHNKVEENAKEWFSAGESNVELNNARAIECFKKASELFSIVFKHAESALSLENSLHLRDYNSLDANGRELYKKDLVDCQIQYSFSGDNEKSSRMYVKFNRIKCSESSFSIRTLYWLFDIVSEYGESPRRVVFSAVLTILMSSIIYTLLGIKSGVLGNGQAIIEKDFMTSLYFSFVTFTTLGYGDYSPIGFARVIATFQAVAGLILTSLFMVSLFRKYSR